MPNAWSIKVKGVVQGVGFRPFVYRLALAHSLAGWVLNGEQGVEIFIEGGQQGCDSFIRDLKLKAPPAARVVDLVARAVKPEGFSGFTIRSSASGERPTTRVS